MGGLREVIGIFSANAKITVVITYLILLSRGLDESPVFKRDLKKKKKNNFDSTV